MKNVQPTRDTIYIDAEDEITAIIEKVMASHAKIVALVLPKRAAALQSVVNLKLLKRSAREEKKSLVLITSEAGLLPIAGAVGLHVAKTLQSKPYVPEAPKAVTPKLHEKSANSDEPALDPQTSVGQLAGHVATEDTIDLDNDAKPDAGANKQAKKGMKKFKIPNFNRFRLMLFGGIGLLILLIVGGIFAFVILPQAKITIKTDTTNVNTDLLITAKTDATEVDKEALIVPAVKKEVKKTDTEKAAATGQRDDGDRAKGTMTVYNCTDSAVSIPAGTTFTNSGFSFAADSAATIPPSDFFSNGTCKKNSSEDVAVTSTKAGGESNLSAGRDYTSNIGSTLTGKGSAMTGGTSKLVQVVSQSDVDSAKDKVVDRLTAATTEELKTQFAGESSIALGDTLTASSPTVLSTPNVNEAGGEVNVSVTITFGMLGVRQDDLKQLVEDEVNKHIDMSKQSIQDNGISTANILITEKKSPAEVIFNIKTLAVAGPQLDKDGIKKQAAGKGKTETEKLIKERPGIKDVTIDYSPFWVFTTPKNTTHITIIFDQNNAED